MSNVFAAVCNVSQDATVNYLPSGQAVLNVSVANNTGFGDKQKTNWIRVVVWGKRAEGTLSSFLKKGQAVFISGELNVNEYTKNDGTKGFQLEVTADILDLVGGKKSDNAQPAYESQQQDPYPPAYQQPPAPQYQQPPAQQYQQPPQNQGYQTPHQQHRQAVAQHNAQAQRPDDDIPF